MEIVNKIIKSDIFIIILIVLSFILIKDSIIPFIAANNEYNQTQKEKEEQENELSELNESIGITEEGEMQRQYARGEYHISKDDEILFVFPEENTDE